MTGELGLLPTRLIIPATIAVILVGLVAALVERDLQVWIRALLGMLALRTFLWILWALRQGGMGFGDVRLGALVGFVLGWFGWAEVIIGIYAEPLGVLLSSLWWGQQR